MRSPATASPADVAAVAGLLGRAPEGRFAVVVRDGDGSPVVIRNEPLLEDGTPMPTRYWLVGRRLQAAVGRLESSGGVRAAEAAVPAEAVAEAHRRYAAERDATLPAGYEGPRPSGGVGGTREGVKCLHAHLAWYLAGGDDPVGAYVARRLAPDLGPVVAVLDCGTNSTRLLVTAGGALPLARQMRITRLGDGVDATGRLSPAAIERTMDALGDYRAIADDLGATRLRAVTTSAARDAANAGDLLARAEALLGCPLEVLDGAEEGRLAHLGATRDLDPAAGPYLVIDLGGGSTELVAGGGPGAAVSGVSLPVGCVRVTERFLASDPPAPAELEAVRAYVVRVVGDALDGHPALAGPPATVSVAGTSSVLAALAAGLDHYDRSRVHLLRLGRDEIDRLAGRLGAATLVERRALLAVEPGRAEVIAGGAVALSAVLSALGRDEVVHSEADILDGMALDLAGRPG